MYLVLDTNILIKEGLYSRNMKILERIVLSGEIKLCVPELVLKEFLTHALLEAKEVMGKTNEHLVQIQTRLPNSEVKSLAEGLINNHAGYHKTLEDNYSKAIDEWVSSYKVEILKLDQSKVTEVFDDYFVGKGVFRSPKFRPDIPDSFIAYSIFPLMDRKEKVNVIIKDAAFRKYLSTKKMSVFSDLDEFLISENIKVIIAAEDAKTQNVEELKTFLASEGAIALLSGLIRNDAENLRLIYVEDEQIGGLSTLGMNTFGETINGTTPDLVHNISVGEAQYVEPGYFSLPVCIEADCQVDYATDYYEYIHLPKSRKNNIEMTSMDGDGVTELSELRNTVLHGYLQVQFDKNWTVKELSSQLSNLADIDESFEVDIEVIGADILKSEEA